MACQHEDCFDFDMHAWKPGRNNNILKTVKSQVAVGKDIS